MIKKLPPNFEIKKYGLVARLVTESDASFILKVRSDPRIVLYMQGTAETLEDQIKWIRKYKERELVGTDFYFIFSLLDGTPQGVERIYGITESSFTIGSWVFANDAEKSSSILADIMMRELGFEMYPDGLCHFDVNVDNINVMRYSLSYKSEFIRQEGKQQYYYCTRENCFNQIRRYLRMLGKI